MVKINKALLSVSDKSGIVDFARELKKYKIQFISTGGTAQILRENGLEIMEVSDYTGYPEMMDGRVKTLHPKIHGGLLGIRSNPEHLHDMREFNIEGIDMIVVNVKSVEKTMINRNITLEDAMNKIDIGGIALLRSAAKNYKCVTAVIDTNDYGAVIDEMKKNNGAVCVATNLQLAIKVFETTARYDSLISDFLRKQTSQTSEKKYIEIPR